MTFEICFQGGADRKHYRDFAEKHLVLALEKFAQHIVTVRIDLQDLTSAGEVSIHCRVVVELAPQGRACVSELADDFHAAVVGAIHRIDCLIAKKLARRV